MSELEGTRDSLGFQEWQHLSHFIDQEIPSHVNTDYSKLLSKFLA